MITDLLGALKELFGTDISLLELPIMAGSRRVGSEISLKIQSGEIIASGSGATKDTALRICIAEAFERGLVMKINSDQKLKNEFQIPDFPTTCGFAAGFENEKTKLRAIAEGLERWAWSQWIDRKCALDETTLDRTILSPLSKIFLSSFTDFNCYKKNLKLTFSGTVHCFELFIFLGFNENGIFPGSRVTIKGDIEEGWAHPVLEAYRCLNNLNVLSASEYISTDDIIANRAIYFGQNKDLALAQIENAQQTSNLWPSPNIALLKEYQGSNRNIYLWRCLIGDYLGWHVGDEKRFVY